jgi:hypothetical protein
MQGAVTWEAAILLVGAIWVVAAVVAYVVWRLCQMVNQIEHRLTVLETRNKP